MASYCGSPTCMSRVDITRWVFVGCGIGRNGNGFWGLRSDGCWVGQSQPVGKRASSRSSKSDKEAKMAKWISN